jgi:hypothetical protein
MKMTLACSLIAALLGGCVDGGPLVFHDAYVAAKARRTNEARYRADLAACGHGAGAEWCRLAADDGNLSRIYPGQGPARPPAGVAYAYDASQCDGVYEHGLCRGVSRPAIPPPICHGQIIDGACSGPEF